MLMCFRSRSRSRGRSDGFEKSFGVSKDTLLHGSYADYIKEYAAKSSRSTGVSYAFTFGRFIDNDIWCV